MALTEEKTVCPLEVKNARARALWTWRYFGGQRCPDYRTQAEREAYEAWYDWRVRMARKFLWRGHGG